MLRSQCLIVCILAIQNGRAVAAPAYTIQELGVVGRTALTAKINNAEQIVLTILPEQASDTTELPGELILIESTTTTSVGALGGSTIEALAINQLGVITGVSETPNGDWHAILYENGTLQDLGSIGAGGSVAYGINDAGDVVGQATYEDEIRAFLRSHDGVISDLGTLGGEFSIAFDINNMGTIVGTSQTEGSTTEHAFARQGNQLIDLRTLGGSASGAFAVNESGTIVGYADTPDGVSRAAVFSMGGEPVALDMSTMSSMAIGINCRDLIVGYLETSPGEVHAALFSTLASPALLEDLIPAGSGWTRLSSATGINDLGQIVGTGIYNDEPGLRAFLMTPIPEPSSLGLIFVALLSFAESRFFGRGLHGCTRAA